MIINLDPKNINHYRKFLQIKRLPAWRIRGREAWFPDEYAATLGMEPERPPFVNWAPSDFLFDYQQDIITLSLRKRKFAIFADCGLGKTLIFIEFAQGAMQVLTYQNKGALMVSPLMVIEQTISEAKII